MKTIVAFVLCLALILPAAALAAEKNAAAELEEQLLKELSKFDYKAKKDVPAADSIFVEKGKLQEGMYKLAMQQGGVLLKAGKTTKVSSVKILDHAVQIFFETDKCAMINLAADTDEPAKLSLDKLLAFSKTSIGALFTMTDAVAPPASDSKEKPADKPEEKKS